MEQERYKFIKQLLITEFIDNSAVNACFPILHQGDKLFVNHQRMIQKNGLFSDFVSIGYDQLTHLAYIPENFASEILDEMVHDKCFFAKIVDIDKAKKKMLVNIYQNNQFPIDDIVGFSYWYGGGYQIGWKTAYFCSFSRAEKKLVYEVILYQREIRHSEIIFADSEWDTVLEELQKCNFHAWENNYFYQDVPDIGEWEVTIFLENGVNKAYRGNSSYPEEWNYFKTFITNCFDFTHIKGNGVCSIISWENLTEPRADFPHKHNRKGDVQ